ncbi:hypothetical protein R3W88_000953 [Solanum pinnatisectum]|uniref:Uncharacterized protein n=1 Tax=Solanum pinnatisectum TaxID=50273 RepID=A0AAV9MH64_9SOLN|nr:hypothetical protein R3W88_000953 [Solanum pinnatisectum]
MRYLVHGRLPEDPQVRAHLKRRAPRFIFCEGKLVHHSYERLFLWCLEKRESQQTMEEAHSGTYEAY